MRNRNEGGFVCPTTGIFSKQGPGVDLRKEYGAVPSSAANGIPGGMGCQLKRWRATCKIKSEERECPTHTSLRGNLGTTHN
jgi:hypothetical protein